MFFIIRRPAAAKAFGLANLRVSTKSPHGCTPFRQRCINSCNCTLENVNVIYNTQTHTSYTIEGPWNALLLGGQPVINRDPRSGSARTQPYAKYTVLYFKEIVDMASQDESIPPIPIYIKCMLKANLQ